MPRPRATSISGPLLVPQSAVTISVRPSSTARSIALSDNPWPSPSRSGTYGAASRPIARSAITRMDSPVSPSASKSPYTRTRSLLACARATRANAGAASGRSDGSYQPSSGGARNAARSPADLTPRLARRLRSLSDIPRSTASTRQIASTAGGSEDSQPKLEMIIPLRMTPRDQPRLIPGLSVAYRAVGDSPAATHASPSRS